MSANGPVTHEILGVPICAATMAGALAIAEDAISKRKRLLIGVVNAAKIVNMRSDAALRDSVLTSDVVFADGMSVVWASKLLGKPLPERVAGIDLMTGLMKRASERGYRVFLLGATDEVLAGVEAAIRRDFPNLQLAGSQNGYYKPDEEKAVADRIADSKADILFVAMTSPKKEIFLGKYAEHMNVPVCHGVGGSFDVMAGKVKRAPGIWQKLGMEWLYRVLQEPGRLWKRYLVTNSAFCWLVLKGATARVFSRRSASAGSVSAHSECVPAPRSAISATPSSAANAAERDLTATVIESADGLQTLRGEWNALLRDSAADSLFQTWEWLSTWLSVRKNTPRVLTVALRDATGRLAAIAPFYASRMSLSGTIGFRCLRVMGDRDSGFEYPDLIVRKGLEPGAIPQIAAALKRHRRAWDCLWLPQTADWTGAGERFAMLAGDGRLRMNTRRADFALMSLPATYDAYFATLSGNQRSNLRRGAKRVEAAGRITIEQCESPEQLAPMMTSLFDLHQKRWQEAGEPGSFGADSPFRRFCEAFAPVALECGWLRLYTLKIDDVITAVQFGYAYGGAFLQMQEGYDPAAPEGVGNVLRERVIRDCIERGLTQYDFLGEFTEHKRRWGAEQRFGRDIFCGRRTVKNRLLFTRPVWPTGRFLREIPMRTAAVLQTAGQGAG